MAERKYSPYYYTREGEAGASLAPEWEPSWMA